MTAPKTPDKPSSRHHVTDERFAALLAEDFGIPATTVLDALEAEPKKAAIAICAWAAGKTNDPAFALRCWARRHGRGAYGRAARTTTEHPARRHGTPRDDRTDDGRGSGPARPGDITPAFVRANLSRMGG